MVLSYLRCFMALETTSLITTIGLGCLVVLLVFLFYKKDLKQATTKQPPGPMGILFLGTLGITDHASLDRKCQEWVKLYGPIFRIKNGSANIVILNDFPSIKTFYSADENVYRPQEATFFEGSRVTKGMFVLSGQTWKDNRSFSLRALRDLGYGKSFMEERIRDEARYMTSKISEAKEPAVSVLDFLIPSMANIAINFLFGTRYNFGHPKLNFLTQNLLTLLEFQNSRPIIEFKPNWLCRIALRLPFTKAASHQRCQGNLHNFMRDRVNEHKTTITAGVNRDFIDGYLMKIQAHKNEQNSNFQEAHLLGTSVDILVGSTTTTAFRIHWLLRMCAQNADTTQRRIQTEIDDVIGCERQPTWEDRKSMPFTMASVLEILRWKPMIPIALPRGATGDTYIGEYFITKSTVTLANLMAVHRDPTLWERPDEFDPTRFLEKGGNKVAKVPEHMIAFSLGKRICPGETLAYVEMFLYIATVLQKFTVFPEEGKQLSSLDSLAITVTDPAIKKLRFVSR